ncbi:hypothetical protein [Arthrobacter sp. TMS1-12-1]
MMPVPVEGAPVSVPDGAAPGTAGAAGTPDAALRTGVASLSAPVGAAPVTVPGIACAEDTVLPGTPASPPDDAAPTGTASPPDDATSPGTEEPVSASTSGGTAGPGRVCVTGPCPGSEADAAGEAVTLGVVPSVDPAPATDTATDPAGTASVPSAADAAGTLEVAPSRRIVEGTPPLPSRSARSASAWVVGRARLPAGIGPGPAAVPAAVPATP